MVAYLRGILLKCLKPCDVFNQLPNETVVCPAHEYTLGNLAFAETILADKSAVENQRVLVERYRAEGKPSFANNNWIRETN